MIAVPAGVKVLIAAKPVDFRKGGDGLVALVREALGEDPFSGKSWPGTDPAWCCCGNGLSTGPSGGRRSATA